MALLKRGRKKTVVKPTAAEQKIIDARLKRMYPQMYKPPAGYTKMLQGMSTVERRKMMRKLGQKGLDEIRKSYKLKRMYGGK